MSAITSRFDDSAPESEIAFDLAKRAVWIAPALVLAGAVGWGIDGALSAGYAIALVVLNFLISATMLAWAGRISLAFVLGVAMAGYVIRLGLIAAAVLLVKDFAWVELVPLGLTLIIAHLGLLLWETRYVSASLAHPGLKPAPAGSASTKE
ncbi:MAG TPA: ATP synthase subunit I [Acidimicrobiales bacterium]|nr:ATP synthase subunit I [Acidimicrobiales bacterium]